MAGSTNDGTLMARATLTAGVSRSQDGQFEITLGTQSWLADGVGVNHNLSIRCCNCGDRVKVGPVLWAHDLTDISNFANTHKCK